MDDCSTDFDRNADRNRDVGYCRPPIETRWQPGQSGNPAGKKPRDESFDAMFSKFANERVTVETSSGPKTMTRLDALIEAVLAKAIKGKGPATKLAIKLMKEYGLRSQTRRPPRPGTIYRDEFGRAKVDTVFTWNDNLTARLTANMTSRRENPDLNEPNKNRRCP